MRKLAAVAALLSATLAVGVAPASGVVIKTNWIEKTQASWGGTYTIYVREIEITKTSFRARVGLVNKTRAAMHIEYGLVRQGPRTTLVHGPGIWYQGPPVPGAALAAARHADATSVSPPLPHRLRAGQSWFATIRGSAAKLPKDRLLRIGFGFLNREGQQYSTEISTTHQFKLPRRLR